MSPQRTVVRVKGGRAAKVRLRYTWQRATWKAFAAITAGMGHTCALDTGGRAWCWGRDASGQVGDGRNRRDNCYGQFYCAFAPTMVAGGIRFTTIHAGGEHTCALDRVGKAWCWGSDWLGEVGDGDNQVVREKIAPVRVAGQHTFTTITTGAAHTCALDRSGRAWCWGLDGYFQLGDGAADQHRMNCRSYGERQHCEMTPVAVTGARTFTTITAGMFHTCALEESGRAWCWGYDSRGAVGDGRSDQGTCGVWVGGADGGWSELCALKPSPVAGGRTFADISAGGEHTCALDSGGKAWCWGDDDSGQLGDGDADHADEGGAHVPVAVAGGRTFTRIDTGGEHTCALDSGGKAWCWGQGDHGQLGLGLRSMNAPGAVKGGLSLAAVTAGGERYMAGHTCGLTTRGKAWCWGDDIYGQIGDGGTTESDSEVTTPVAVAGM